MERSTSNEFRECAVEWLSRAVKIRYVFAFILDVEANLNHGHRTESYDYMEPVGIDPCWDVFGEFHNYLLWAFPLVYVFSHIRIKSLTEQLADIPPWHSPKSTCRVWFTCGLDLTKASNLSYLLHIKVWL